MHSSPTTIAPIREDPLGEPQEGGPGLDPVEAVGLRLLGVLDGADESGHLGAVVGQHLVALLDPVERRAGGGLDVERPGHLVDHFGRDGGLVGAEHRPRDVEGVDHGRSMVCTNL